MEAHGVQKNMLNASTLSTWFGEWFKKLLKPQNSCHGTNIKTRDSIVTEQFGVSNTTQLLPKARPSFASWVRQAPSALLQAKMRQIGPG